MFPDISTIPTAWSLFPQHVVFTNQLFSFPCTQMTCSEERFARNLSSSDGSLF